MVLLYEQTHVTQMETKCEGLWFWYCYMSKPMRPKWKQNVGVCVVFLVLLYEQTHVAQMETRCEEVWFWYCCMSKPI